MRKIEIRKCERCNCEMRTMGGTLVTRGCRGVFENKIMIDYQEFKETELIDEIFCFFDKNPVPPSKTIRQSLEMDVAICPECGKIEFFLDSEQLNKYNTCYQKEIAFWNEYKKGK